MFNYVTETKTRTFYLNEGFQVDVTEIIDSPVKDFWLYHPDCEIKMWMFALETDDLNAMKMIINNATPEYIDYYFSTYMGILE